MGKKYIIEFEDKPFHKDGDFLYRIKGFNSLVFDMTGIGKLTSYTTDLERVKKTAHDDGYSAGYQAGREDLNRVMSGIEQVKDEWFENGYENGFVDGHLKAEKSGQKFYEDGYKRGLSDAWEAARKIALDKEDGGLDTVAYCEIFGYGKGFSTILKTFSAFEAIEKIRQYEQKKQESITAEDVMRQYLDTFCEGQSSCGECPLNTEEFTCGRGFGFINHNIRERVTDEEVRRAYSTVLAKMREGQDE